MKWSKIFVRFNEIKFAQSFKNQTLCSRYLHYIYYVIVYITFCFINSLIFIFFKFFRLMWREKDILCTKVITYGGCGFPSLSDHMKTENHVHNVVIKLKNYRLPGTSNPVHEQGGMYSTPAVYLDQATGSSSLKTPPQSAVHILDHNANMEAMVVSFLAEKRLSFILAGK